MFDCFRALVELGLFVSWLMAGGADAPPDVCCAAREAVAPGCVCKECVCGQGKGKCCCGEPCKCPDCPGKQAACAPMPAPSPVAFFVNGAMPEPIPVPPPVSPFCCPVPPPLPPAVASGGNLPSLAHFRLCYPGEGGRRQWTDCGPVVIHERKGHTFKLARHCRPEEPPCHDRLQVAVAPCARDQMALNVQLEQCDN